MLPARKIDTISQVNILIYLLYIYIIQCVANIISIDLQKKTVQFFNRTSTQTIS